MDFIATVFGLQLLTLKARDSLKRHHYCARAPVIWEAKVVWGIDQQDLWEVPDKTKCDDDETASTVSDCDDSLSSSSSSSESLASSVTFAAPLVTAVHLRPYTDFRDREALHYNETDFRKFRMDYRLSLFRRQNKRPSVTFSDSVVSQVYDLPEVENKHEVYYSSAELKQFLEDFIRSLDEKHGC